MDTRMSIDEGQTFLDESRVGIISIPQEGHGLLTVVYSKLGSPPK